MGKTYRIQYRNYDKNTILNQDCRYDPRYKIQRKSIFGFSYCVNYSMSLEFARNWIKEHSMKYWENVEHYKS
jgi:hypothetical protein